MILKRYGVKLQSVQPNFDARAMNEVGFTRDNELVIPADEFAEQYEKTEAHELTAAAEGDVQGEAEEKLLESLQQQLEAVVASVPEGGVVVIESDQSDYPKTRHTTQNTVVEGVNRLYFRFTVEPPLRVAVYRRR